MWLLLQQEVLVLHLLTVPSLGSAALVKPTLSTKNSCLLPVVKLLLSANSLSMVWAEPDKENKMPSESVSDGIFYFEAYFFGLFYPYFRQYLPRSCRCFLQSCCQTLMKKQSGLNPVKKAKCRLNLFRQRFGAVCAEFGGRRGSRVRAVGR